MDYIYVKGVVEGKAVDLKCSRLIMGSADYLREDNLEQVAEMMDVYLKNGGNVLDTAHQYEFSDKAIGRWMERYNTRSRIHIVSKCAHHDDGEPGPRVNPKAITKDLLESLERMRTDYVDMLALHRDDPSVEVGPIMEVLNEHIEAGRVHAIGASNWTIERIQAANDYAASHGLIGFTFSSPNLSLAKCRIPRWPGCVSADQACIEWHQRNGMPLLSWSSQAGGFFSGRFSPDIRDNQEMVDVYYTDENWERYDRAKIMAKEKGVTPIQIALAYVLNQTFPTAAIIGPEKVEELESSLYGASIKLTNEEVDWLDLKK